MAVCRGQRASTKDPEYEAQMELAVKGFHDGTYKTINAAVDTQEGVSRVREGYVPGIL